MGFVRKADFYYGSMLSGLVNNGIAPAIIEPGDSRRIYELTTNKGDFLIYAKYVSAPMPRQRTDAQLWQFSFTSDEIRFIREHSEDRHKLYFAFICGQRNFQDSEIAFLSLDEVKKCLDVDHERPNYRVSIKTVRGSRYLRAYGTGLADILNGQDNTIRIQRDYAGIFLNEPQLV